MMNDHTQRRFSLFNQKTKITWDGFKLFDDGTEASLTTVPWTLFSKIISNCTDPGGKCLILIADGLELEKPAVGSTVNSI